MTHVGPSVKRGRRLLITVLIDPDQVYRLDRLAQARRTSRSAVIREAIEILLTCDMHNSRISDNHRDYRHAH